MNHVDVNTDRRRLLKQGLALAATSITGCGGGVDAEPAAVPAAQQETWTPYVPALIVGSGATFDLSGTLPTNVKRGGTFSLDTSGARLPAGMSLSPSGILAVGAAAIGSVTGVIFTYDAP